MNYIVDDLAKIIENKAEGKETINLWLSAQVNSFPHIGTLTNFISAFALAKHYEEYFGKPVKIIVELLESVTGKEEIINNIRYYTNLEKTILDSGE